MFPNIVFDYVIQVRIGHVNNQSMPKCSIANICGQIVQENGEEMIKKKPVDRRIQRTRQLLLDALLSLILEKDFDSITVQDVIDRANVGRSTFYAHFQDKDELLLSGFEHL